MPRDSPLRLRPIVTHPSAWEPAEALCALNVSLDGVIVQSETEGFRADTAHVVVLDDFVPRECCEELLHLLTAPGYSGASPPEDKWERATADGPGLPVSWGLKDDAMSSLLNGGDVPCLHELHSRLQKLYPDYIIVHQPVFGGERTVGESDGAGNASSSGNCVASSGGRDDAKSGTVCESFVANAAVQGDTFLWHVDGDPSDVPDGAWRVHHVNCRTEAFGRYRNRDAGCPLFVSAILYLNERWEPEWAAETLFADSPTGTGVFVRPRRGRLVLMDQDVRHRVNAPSALAPQPRYSFVEKLIFIPTEQCKARPCIALPAWGRPSALGSAANLRRASGATATSAVPGSGAAQQPHGEGSGSGGAAGGAVGGAEELLRSQQQQAANDEQQRRGECGPQGVDKKDKTEGEAALLREEEASPENAKRRRQH